MYVNIGRCWGSEDNFIWTLKMHPDGNSEKLPIVLLHGFASGIGMWISNLDSLSVHHPLYALDLLGFGRSSRPIFSLDASEAEQQFTYCMYDSNGQNVFHPLYDLFSKSKLSCLCSRS